MKRLLRAISCVALLALLLPSTALAGTPKPHLQLPNNRLMGPLDAEPVGGTKWEKPDPTAHVSGPQSELGLVSPLATTGAPANCRSDGGYAYHGIIGNATPNVDGAYGIAYVHPLYPCYNPSNHDPNISVALVLPANIQYNLQYLVQIGYKREYSEASSQYIFEYTKYDNAWGGLWDAPSNLAPPVRQGDRYEFSVWYVRADNKGQPNWEYWIKDDYTGQVGWWYGAGPASFSSTGQTGLPWWGFETHDTATVMDDETGHSPQSVYATTFRANYGSWTRNCYTFNASDVFLPSWYHVNIYNYNCAGDSLYVNTDAN